MTPLFLLNGILSGKEDARLAKDTYIFRRIEKKYMITPAQRESLMEQISHLLIPDAYGKSTICSVYLDTPDFRLIRASIDAKVYKEKLRLRSYGTPNDDSRVFLEIKKKFKGVVYKRRISLTLAQATAYFERGERPFDSQIMREIDYAMRFYGQPAPAALIAYEREAYFVRDLPALRITFDTGVRYRLTELSAKFGSDGTPIIPADCILMEIKTDGAMPCWLATALDRARIFPSSFSKYGTAYREFALHQPSPYQISKGEPQNAGIV